MLKWLFMQDDESIKKRKTHKRSSGSSDSSGYTSDAGGHDTGSSDSSWFGSHAGGHDSGSSDSGWFGGCDGGGGDSGGGCDGGGGGD